jgi:Tfp pilus assembly major pilin PilA
MDPSSVPPVHPQAEAPTPPLAGEPQPCGQATASMVCGIVGLFTCLPGIAAVILGHIALSRIRKSGNMLTGRGRAIAGLVMGYLVVGFMAMLPVIGILAAIAIPSFMQAKERAQAAMVLNEVRQLDAAKDQYALETQKGSEITPAFGDLTPYLKKDSGLVERQGKDVKGNPYNIGPIGTPPSVSPETREEFRRIISDDGFWGPYS